MNRIEDNIQSLSEKVNQIDLQIHTNAIPTQGVFFEGRVFDAYELFSKIIRLQPIRHKLSTRLIE